MSDDILQFSPIEEIVEEIRKGQMVIVTDDPSRENEGDLICAAQFTTPEMINFMVTHARGLVCAPLSPERVAELKLPLMTSVNRENMSTAFTVTVDAAAKHGITTGISAAERATTIRLLGDAKATNDDFIQPGHVFPLRAVEGGVLRRAGHTETTIDLLRLAGLQPAGVCCEIMNEDGSMARIGNLGSFQRKHQLKACTTAQLIEYRRKTEKFIECVEKVQLPTDYGDFTCYLYKSLLDGAVHLALVHGDIADDQPTLVRVHSECLTGDVFGSRRCDCGSQLHVAMKQIAEEGGVLLYLRQEGRGIGLEAKLHAYKLQEQGLDTVEANIKLGFAPDLRDYGIGAQILNDLGVNQLRLLTNNPKKIIGLQGFGLEVVEQLPIRIVPNETNRHYLETKRCKMGHTL
ncbi:MAG: bifunctional 3,4-dihydroxy-2-butanone-4-phosphate synthase/GTP cyclohydrolase II [Akkermansia sp.]